MMKMLSYVAIASLAIVASAQNMENIAAITKGFCMPAMMGPDSPMNMFARPDRMPACFKGVKIPKRLEEMFTKCKVMEKFYAEMMNEDKTIESLTNTVNDLQRCGMDALDLQDGTSINWQQMEIFQDDLTGDPKLIKDARAIVSKCKGDLEPTGDPVEDMNLLQECCQQGMFDACSERGEDTGMLGVSLSMFTLDQPAKCTTVDLKSRIMPVIVCLLKSMMMRMKGMKTMKGKFGGNDVDPADMMMKPDRMAMMAMSLFQSLGAIDENTGAMNFDVIKALVSELRGWDDLEMERDAILSAITRCGRNAPFNGLSDVEIAQRWPFIPKMHPAVYQFHQFLQCFSPVLSKNCGIKNQLGLVFNPMLMKVLPKAELEAIMGGSMDEMKDLIMEQVTADESMESFSSMSCASPDMM